MKKVAIITAIILTVLVPIASTLAFSSPAVAGARDAIQRGVDDAGGSSSDGNLTGFIDNAVNILLWVIGLLSVAMIIVSGIFYVTSSGDSGRVKKAKDTLIYSIVGLVIAILAYAIVNFVIANL